MTKLPDPPPPNFIRVRLSELHDSPSNPRQHFDQAKLKELGESIRLHGLLQAPVVRIRRGGGKGYEIVVGHRRVHAARLIGRTEITVQLMAMEDHDVAAKQLVENDDREDITPLERAEGYQKLLNDHGMNVEEIARSVNRSRAWVYSTLLLMKLCPDARNELAQGELKRSIAELIGGVPLKKDQEEVLELAMGRTKYGQKPKLTYDEVKELIRAQYSGRLDKVPFDIHAPGLVPSAGACDLCPKRSDAEGREGKGPASCLDLSCLARKTAAHKRAVVSDAKEAAKPVLNAGESKAALREGYFGTWVRLTDTLSKSANGKTTVAGVLAGLKLEPQLAVTENGKLVKVVKKADLKKALAGAGAKGAKLAASNLLDYTETSRTRDAEPTKEDKAAAKKLEAERLAAEDVHRKVAAHAAAMVVEHVEDHGLTGKLLRLVAKQLACIADPSVFDRRGLKRGKHWGIEAKDFDNHFSNASDAALLGLMFECVDPDLTRGVDEYSETLAEACELIGVNLGKLEEEFTPAKPEPEGPIKWGPIVGGAITGFTKSRHAYKVEGGRWFGQGQGGECSSVKNGMQQSEERAARLAANPGPKLKKNGKPYKLSPIPELPDEPGGGGSRSKPTRAGRASA